MCNKLFDLLHSAQVQGDQKKHLKRRPEKSIKRHVDGGISFIFFLPSSFGTEWTLERIYSSDRYHFQTWKKKGGGRIYLDRVIYVYGRTLLFIYDLSLSTFLLWLDEMCSAYSLGPTRRQTRRRRRKKPKNLF